MPPSLTLQPADDAAYVERLLSRNDLPTDDLPAELGTDRSAAVPSASSSGSADTGPATGARLGPTETRFYVARRDGDRVGCGGIERDGEVALLRSVVVTRDHRGDGLGAALCDRLVDRAARAGVESVYLLTTDAADFFASVGFTTVPRGSVPDAIRETTQFADLCPDSATVMRRAADR